jgi:glucose uptake protein GlcU
MAIVAIVLWVVALAFIFVTVTNMIVRAVKVRRCTAVTNGVITSIKEKVSRRNGVTSREYIPSVSYTVARTEYTNKYKKAYVAGTYTIGQTVEIVYNPEDPSEINTKGTSNKADIVMLCIGVVIGIVGMIFLMI